MGNPTDYDASLNIASRMTLTQTQVTLAAATSNTLIAGNTARKFLAFTNVGGHPCTIAPGAAAAVEGAGFNLNSGATAADEGGRLVFDTHVPTGAFQAISTTGTVVTVWEGV